MIEKLIRAALFLMSRLPLPVARALGASVGQVAWWSRGRGATTTTINLRACFPGLDKKERSKLAARSMRHWGMTLFEIPVVWHRGLDSLNWIKNIEGVERLHEAQAAGKGVMIVSPHLGNWELVGYWAATQGPITTLYQPPRRFNLDDLLRHVRAKTGATLVPTNARGVSSLIKALKRGELVGILPDMEPETRGGIFAPFFGVQALTMTLIHNLVKRSEAAVFIGFARRVPGGFNLVFVEPGSEIAAESSEVSVTALNGAIEALVNRAPEQYQWEYKRFKRRPEGQPKLYG